VETQNGEWWMVLLATRPYGGYYYNLGRESFMVPVIWEDGWPIVSPGSGRIEFEYPAPDLPEHRWPPQPERDNFESETLDLCWNFLRTPREDFWSLTERPGFLRLRLRPQTLSERANPSFVGRRQQHINFSARAAMDFAPGSANECAGLVLLQSNDYHFRFVVAGTEQGGSIARLIKREAGQDACLAEQPIGEGRVYLKVEAYGQDYNFCVGTAPEAWQPVAEAVDGRILSTPVAGGFVGAYIGMYAGSNGQSSANTVDFDWFEYVELG
jgi:alpha-N-arabinofuranosidase